jgi:hypothetical protein
VRPDVPLPWSTALDPTSPPGDVLRPLAALLLHIARKQQTTRREQPADANNHAPHECSRALPGPGTAEGALTGMCPGECP